MKNEIIKVDNHFEMDGIIVKCLCCGVAPKTIDPLPDGWVWDIEKDGPYAWCPKWHNNIEVEKVTVPKVKENV